MIRFAWLQFRTQAAVAAAALTIVAVVLALTGLELAHLYDTTVAICAAHYDCAAATTSFTAADGPLQVFSDFLLLVVPFDQAGHTPTTSFLSRACPLGNYGPLNPRDCTARLAATFHQLVAYQPGSRYWPMQWSELAIFLGLSIVLGGFCFWWIRRPVI